MSVTEPDWKKTRGRLARLSQDLPPDAPQLLELRGDLKTQRAAEYIARIVAEAPPLSDEQRVRLAELLRPARAGGGGCDAA